MATYEILLSKKSEVEHALAKLVRRAARKGLDGVLAWTWGKAYQAEEHVPNRDGNPPTPSAVLSGAWRGSWEGERKQ